MPSIPAQTISATGFADLDPVTNGTVLNLGPGDSDLFVGISGTYSGLTLRIEGSRSGNAWYDIASYTSDDIGPLATPLSPADSSSIAYKGDVRTWTQVRLNVLSLASGSFTLEVMSGSFFPQRAGASLSGALAQLIYEMRAVRATLASWIGLPGGPLPNLQNEVLGSGVGKSFPN